MNTATLRAQPRCASALGGSPFSSLPFPRAQLLGKHKRSALRPRSLQEPVNEVYQGVYGPWTVEEEDIREVYGYRAGLTVAAAAVSYCTAVALIPETWEAKQSLATQLDSASFAGAAGLGLSLVLIHIYVTPIKRALQVLWAIGISSAAFFALNEDQGACQFVVNHPEAMWLVGPLFASLTGVAVKEGLCYGKTEAAVLAVLLPVLMGGHLLQILPVAFEQVLLVALNVTLWVFVSSKYSQPIKDDLGDKSVFMFRKLSPEEQRAVLASKGVRDD